MDPLPVRSVQGKEKTGMVHRRFVTIIALIVVALAVNGNTWARDSLEQAKASAPLAPAGTAFTYQGQLNGTGGPVTDTCDFQFSLWDSSMGGTQIAGTLTLTAVGVTDGLFTVPLNFGPAFDGNARWLEIAVRCPAGSGTYNTLAPRQELTPTPYAMDADMLDGLHFDAFALAGHAHWGETWSGTGGMDTGLTLQGGGVGLYGMGSVAGVEGLATAAHGAGVVGLGSGPAAGVMGVSVDGNPIEAYSQGEGNRQFYVDTYGRVYAIGAVPVLPRAQAPVSNTFHTVDSTGDVGAGSSATIGVDGLPLIAYLDTTNEDLKVAHCDDAACTSAATTTADTGSVGDSFPSATIGADGLPLIAYISGGLKVAHCEDIACSTATLTLLHSSGSDVDPSVTIGTDGLGLISFGSGTAIDVAHCANTACTSATVSSLGTGAYADGTSVTIGADGRGLISYNNSISIGLEVAHCNNVACTGATITQTPFPSALTTSVTVGADGLGLVTYYGYGGWEVMHCDDVPCTSQTRAVVGDYGDGGGWPSVTIGVDGLALISSYYEIDTTHGTLLVAHCTDVACSQSVVTTLASSGGSVGMYSSVTIGADGLPLISYYDKTNGDLRAAHCADAFCVNYLRRR